MKRLQNILLCTLASLWVSHSGHAEQSALQNLGPIVTLTNGTVTADIAATLGRITRFQRAGEKNWIQVFDEPSSPNNDYKPWGGDRIWPLLIQFAPQVYGIPNFDLAIEDGPWTITESGPHFLELRSPASPRLGIRLTRRIELSSGGKPGLIHHTRIERVAARSFPVQVWAVTSIPSGDAAFMERQTLVRQTDYTEFKRWHPISEEPTVRLLADGRVLRVDFARDKIKVGTYGRWIAVTRGRSAFLQTTDYDSTAFYPDESSLQFYSEAGRAYHELETLSPSWFLQVGETREWTVRWILLDFPSDIITDEHCAANLAEAAAHSLP